MHLDVYKPTNKCQSGLEQHFCTYIFCQNCSNSIIMEIGLMPGSSVLCVCFMMGKPAGLAVIVYS